MTQNKSENMFKKALIIDPMVEVEKISLFIQDHFDKLNRKTAVIGLSGGLDSSLTTYLAVRSLGKSRVKCFYLPERDSKSMHRKHAKQVAEQLGIKLKVIRIGPALRSLSVYRQLPLRFLPGRKLKQEAVKYARNHLVKNKDQNLLSVRLSADSGSWVKRANAYISAKHRMRMTALYMFAERLQGLVIGAANKSEWMTGTFTQWGCDHCADLMPLLHLYRSQLIPLGKHLGVPVEILNKKADPDVLPGLDDKGKLLGSFEKADLILWGLENDLSIDHLENQFGVQHVSFIQKILESSKPFREAPYSLL